MTALEMAFKIACVTRRCCFPPRDIIEQQRLHFARLLSSGHIVKWSQILLVRGIRIHRQIYM